MVASKQHNWLANGVMHPGLAETTLSNGRSVYCLRRSEGELVYRQVQHYFKHGITIGEGDTVFDVGANIGMFSLAVHERAGGSANIFAFEPIPATFAALEANVQRYCSGQVRTFCCGLSAQPGEIEFGFYPHFTMLSSAYNSAADEEEIREQLKSSIIRNISDAHVPLSWLRWLPRSLQARALDWATRRSFREMEIIRCPLRTITDIIHEYQLTGIDLLKVDVEKSELDVLLGIDEPDWPSIRQVVMEVHNIDRRLDQIQALLREHRIDDIVIEQETMLRGSNVFSLYAQRR